MDAALRILIVDDHATIRETIRLFLKHQTEYIVCGEAENGVSAVAQARRLRPDLIIMDLSLPKRSGLQTACLLKKFLPSVKIVAFSIYGEELTDALHGASPLDAALPKSAGVAVLVETIRRLLPRMTRAAR